MWRFECSGGHTVEGYIAQFEGHAIADHPPGEELTYTYYPLFGDTETPVETVPYTVPGAP